LAAAFTAGFAAGFADGLAGFGGTALARVLPLAAAGTAADFLGITDSIVQQAKQYRRFAVGLPIRASWRRVVGSADRAFNEYLHSRGASIPRSFERAE
jgi:hypothetical protein